MAVAMAAALAVATGCGTAYRPQSTDRISFVIRGAAPMYIKGGKAVPVGAFSTPLETLVSDTPSAVPHARAARRHMKIGVPAYLGGFGALSLGIFVLSGPVGWAVLSAGALSAGTGLVFMGRGTSEVVDAMNIHNDEVHREDSLDPETPRL